MINFRDRYWRQMAAWAVVSILVVSVVALSLLPFTADEGADHGGGPEPPHGFHVSPVSGAPGPEAGTVEYAVEVANDEPGRVSNISATIEGATLANVADSTDGFDGRVGLSGPGQHQSASRDFDLVGEVGATFALQGTSVAPTGSLTLTVKAPSGKSWTGTGGSVAKSVALSASDLQAGGEGAYTATVAHAGGLRAISFNLTVTLQYPTPQEALSWPALGTNESHMFRWLADDASLASAIRVVVAGERADADGGLERYVYRSGVAAEPVEVGMVGAPFLTSGEFLGFVGLGILVVGAGSGFVRARGGRTKSQQRTRPSVRWHRIAYLAVVAVLVVHGLVQFVSGHFALASASVGTAAFAGVLGLIWFNAFQRARVLAMPWRRWLYVKVFAVTLVFGFAIAHIVLFGRMFGP